MRQVTANPAWWNKQVLTIEGGRHLTLSEVAFDHSHQYAVMNFSFVCGGLCGHGGTVVLQKQDGKWNRLNRQCGGWVS